MIHAPHTQFVHTVAEKIPLKYFFFLYTIRVWNKLDLKLRNVESSKKFRNTWSNYI